MSVSTIAVIAAAILFFLLFTKIIRLPIRWGLRFLLHAAAGFVFLFCLNFLGAFLGIHIPINFFSAAAAGIMGIPGVILLLVIQYIL